MKNSFGQALGLVNRCPACARNLRQIFCYMTCAPYHSNYLEPKTIINVTNGNETFEVIETLNYYVRNSYAEGLWDSCREVTNPSSNGYIINTFCGGWGELCDAQK